MSTASSRVIEGRDATVGRKSDKRARRRAAYAIVWARDFEHRHPREAGSWGVTVLRAARDDEAHAAVRFLNAGHVVPARDAARAFALLDRRLDAARRAADERWAAYIAERSGDLG